MFSALQAWSLRQGPVKKLLNIPTPKKIAPPPNDAYIDPNPSIKDSIKAAMEFHHTMMDKVTNARRDANELHARRESLRTINAKRPGSEHPTQVREQGFKRTRTAGFLEAAQAEADKEDAPVLSADEAKRQRVAEARRKRQSRN